MLVQCPKCGFDQPKDVYCAKCGVDMEHFKPRQPSFQKRMASSSFFYLFLLALLGFGTYKGYRYLKKNSALILETNSALNKPSLNPVNPYTNPSKPKNETSTIPPGRVEPTTAANTPSEPPAPTPVPTPNQNQTLTPTKLASVDPATSGTPTTPPTTDKEATRETNTAKTDDTLKDSDLEHLTGPLKLDIYYFEAPVSAIQKFLTESADDSKGDSGEMSYGIIKNGNRWLKQPAFTSLEVLHKSVPNIKQKLRWYSGTTEPSTGAPYGFNFQVTLLERQAGHFAGEISISRSTVELNEGSSPTSNRKDFYTQFETSAGAVIGITGILPNQPPKSEDKEWLQEPILKVFNSPAYISGETDLLILFQFNGDSK